MGQFYATFTLILWKRVFKISPFCFTEEKSHTGWERHDDELTIPLSMEKKYICKIKFRGKIKTDKPAVPWV